MKILTPRDVCKQEIYFKRRKVPKEFSAHCIQVSTMADGILEEHQQRLGLSNERRRALTMLALYHVLPSVESADSEVVSLISKTGLIDRFHKYRQLDEAPINSKDILGYRTIMFPNHGDIDPVFLIRAIDIGETHEFKEDKLTRLYRVLYNREVNGLELRRCLAYSMLEIYYPITDSLHFINSDKIKNIAVEIIFHDNYRTIKNERNAILGLIKSAQDEIYYILERVLSIICAEKGVIIVPNRDGKIIYTSRIKDEGSIVLKILKQKLPLSVNFINDMIGFLVVCRRQEQTMKLASALTSALAKEFKDRPVLDPKYLVMSEIGRVYPAAHIDLTTKVIEEGIAHSPLQPVMSKDGRIISPVGVEIQIVDFEGAMKCTQGSLIHGAYKQFQFFNRETVIDQTILNNLIEYLARIYATEKALHNLPIPDLDAERSYVRCTIVDKKGKKKQLQVYLREGSNVIDLLARIGVLGYEVKVIDQKTERSLKLENSITGVREITVILNRDNQVIVGKLAHDLMKIAIEPETLTVLQILGKNNKNNIKCNSK